MSTGYHLALLSSMQGSNRHPYDTLDVCQRSQRGLDGALRGTTAALAVALLSSPPSEIAQDFLLGFVECPDSLSTRPSGSTLPGIVTLRSG
jgi:hypothetical protein